MRQPARRQVLACTALLFGALRPSQLSFCFHPSRHRPICKHVARAMLQRTQQRAAGSNRDNAYDVGGGCRVLGQDSWRSETCHHCWLARASPPPSVLARTHGQAPCRLHGVRTQASGKGWRPSVRQPGLLAFKREVARTRVHCPPMQHVAPARAAAARTTHIRTCSCHHAHSCPSRRRGGRRTPHTSARRVLRGRAASVWLPPPRARARHSAGTAPERS